VEQRRRDENWNEPWADQYRRADDPPFAEVVTFLKKSGRAQSNRRNGLRAVAVLFLAVLSTSLYYYRQRALADDELARAAAAYQRQLDENQSAQSRLRELEAEQAKLKSQATSAATPQEQARLAELQRQIDAAKGQAKGSQDELAKLKKDSELSDSDRGRLLKQVESLQAQLTQVTSERDKLQTQKPPTTSSTPDDRALLQKQLQDERNRTADATAEITKLRAEVAALKSAPATSAPGVSSGASNATVQDVTRAFTEGVRAYDLGNWKASAQYMQDAIRMQSSVKQPPKEVRMSGTRFVPYAPQSYLSAALFELKSDCAAVAAALKQAETEPVPPDVRSKLQAARKQCAAAP
jgi:peptidoglycan hydrolase CwlO-like protein